MALIESFLSRRDALEPQVRFDMADRIVKDIYSRVANTARPFGFRRKTA
jgi:hypothetical protein